jgi:hypothetical protein
VTAATVPRAVLTFGDRQPMRSGGIRADFFSHLPASSGAALEQQNMTNSETCVARECVPQLRITECPICGGQLRATECVEHRWVYTALTLQDDRLRCSEEDAPSEEDDLATVAWRVYCAGDHTEDEMVAALQAKQAAVSVNTRHKD